MMMMMIKYNKTFITVIYRILLKTESLDNAILAFWLA